MSPACSSLVKAEVAGKLSKEWPPNPALTLTRLSLRSRLREGAAKNPCQQGFGSQSPGRLRHRWARRSHALAVSRPMAKIGPMRGGYGLSLAQHRLRPTPIGAVLLAMLGLRSAPPHCAARAPPVPRSLGGQLNFRHWASKL